MASNIRGYRRNPQTGKLERRVPLQALNNRERRRLTSSGSTRGNSSSHTPHQGSQEMERRRKRMERAAALSTERKG